MFEIEDLKAVKKMLISILEDLDEEKLNHLLTK
jgi:hypothetical protein